MYWSVLAIISSVCCDSVMCSPFQRGCQAPAQHQEEQRRGSVFFGLDGSTKFRASVLSLHLKKCNVFGEFDPSVAYPSICFLVYALSCFMFHSGVQVSHVVLRCAGLCVAGCAFASA